MRTEAWSRLVIGIIAITGIIFKLLEDPVILKFLSKIGKVPFKIVRKIQKSIAKLDRKRTQRVVAIIGILLLFLMCIFPPYQTPYGYNLGWRLFTPTGIINIRLFALQAMALSLLTSAVYLSIPFFIGKCPKVISAEKFLLVDGNGKSHAALELWDDTSPRLSFQDNDGKIRVVLGLSSDGNPVLLLADNEQELRVMLYLRTDEMPSLAFFDKSTNQRTGFGLLADGRPYLSLWNEDGMNCTWTYLFGSENGNGNEDASGP